MEARSQRWPIGQILEGFERKVKEVMFYSGLKDFKCRGVRFTLKIDHFGVG